MSLSLCLAAFLLIFSLTFVQPLLKWRKKEASFLTDIWSMKNAPSVCFYFLTLIQLEEEEPARVVISIDSLLSLFKQPATILQLQLCSFSNLLTDRSDYWINYSPC